MEHFNSDLSSEHRYKNEMMEHMRRQTKSLEQIAQLLKPVKQTVSKPIPRKTPQKSKAVK